MIAEDVKWKNHINDLFNKANIILGFLKRTFESRDPLLWKDLYVALIRPHLKFKLVQRWGVKIPKGYENLSYSERLRRLNLTSLKDRRKSSYFYDQLLSMGQKKFFEFTIFELT